MPVSSPVPGRFRTKKTPYMIPIVRAFSQPVYRRNVSVMGTQMGKSASFQNVMGWRMDDDPTPLIYIGPTQGNIDKVVEPKMMEMIGECRSLSLKLARGKSESSKHRKVIGGVPLRFAWAGSPTEIASDSAGLTLVDEVDRPDENSSGEGSLVEVAEARGDAFANSQTAYTSTPLLGKVAREKDPVTDRMVWGVAEADAVSSPIWKLWQTGTRHEWCVPCPHCGEYFSPCSDDLMWPGRGAEDECSPVEARKKSWLACPMNGCVIHAADRKAMNAKGVALAPGQSVAKTDSTYVWIEQADEVHRVEWGWSIPTLDGNDTFSCWVSGLLSFSAKKTFGFLARKLCAALQGGDPTSIQPVYNTGFGEIYSMAGDAPTWEAVRGQSWRYKSRDILGCPDGILCTVDVQKNRLVFVVRAWYRGMASALVECGELWGDTSQDDVWNELDELMDSSYGEYGIDDTGVDCGYRDDQVFDFVRAHKGRARALRGGSLDKPYRAVKLDVDSKGKTRKRGDTRWDFDSSRAKSWVHSRIGISHKRRGFWLLPVDIDEAYCKEIVGEEFNERSATWKRLGDNHFLDCEAMQYMLARMRRLDRKPGNTLLVDLLPPELLEKAAEVLGVDVNPEPVSSPVVAPAVVEPVVDDGYSDGWLGGDGGAWI